MGKEGAPEKVVQENRRKTRRRFQWKRRFGSCSKVCAAKRASPRCVGKRAWRRICTTAGARSFSKPEMGGRAGTPYDLGTLHPESSPAFGIKNNREKSTYEASTPFSDYPAKRLWYPFRGNLYQEVILSAGDGYPDPIEALFLHMGTPAMATPAGHKQIEILRDPARIPLFFACDVVIGETSMYATTSSRMSACGNSGVHLTSRRPCSPRSVSCASRSWGRSWRPPRWTAVRCRSTWRRI